MLLRRVSILLLVVAALAAAPGPDRVAADQPRATATAPDTRFTIAVLPDTQYAVESRPAMFYAQTQWLAEHSDDLDIRFVLHVGDIVQEASRRWEWRRAKDGMARLDGHVPYAISIGNHDFDDLRPRVTRSFNRTFARHRYAARPAYGGSWPATTMTSSWFTFRAGDRRWLVLSLPFKPTASNLRWASRVIRSHPGHRVLVNTHRYQHGWERTSTGDQIWRTLRRRPNVGFVFSGHHVDAAVRVDRGVDGNRVYGIHADYQTRHRPRFHDNSYLRLLTFDTAAHTVRVRTYSPWCEETGACPAYKKSSANQFVLRGVPFPR